MVRFNPLRRKPRHNPNSSRSVRKINHKHSSNKRKEILAPLHFPLDKLRSLRRIHSKRLRARKRNIQKSLRNNPAQQIHLLKTLDFIRTLPHPHEKPRPSQKSLRNVNSEMSSRKNIQSIHRTRAAARQRGQMPPNLRKVYKHSA
jgi:hypothetical protein